MTEEDININDMKKLSDLTNEYMEKFLTILDPGKYDKKLYIFITTSLTSPCVIAAEIIDKI